MRMVTVEEVSSKIARCLGVGAPDLTPDTVLTDLVADSFRLVETAIELQEDYDVIFTQQDLATVTTVADLARLVQARL